MQKVEQSRFLAVDDSNTIFLRKKVRVTCQLFAIFLCLHLQTCQRLVSFCVCISVCVSVCLMHYASLMASKDIQCALLKCAPVTVYRFSNLKHVIS